MLPVVHGDLRDAHPARILERLEQQGLGLLASLVGSHVVGSLQVDRVNLVGFHELQDLHHLRRRRSHLLDLFVFDDDVAVLFVFETLYDFTARDGFVFGLAIQDLLDARAVVFVELVETDALTAGSGVQFDRERDQPEGKMPFPNCGCHNEKAPLVEDSFNHYTANILWQLCCGGCA